MRNMEWKKYELEELMEKSGIVRGPFGGMLKKEIFVDKGYKVYEQKNAINSNYVDGRYYVTKEKYNELSRFKVRKNDFIVSCSGTIGKIYKIPEDAPQGIINQALLKLTINTKILDIDFFEQYFKWESFQDKIMENSQGGAIKNLVGMKTFRKIELLIPSLKEQKKIAEILSTWDDAIELKENYYNKVDQQINSVKNKLFKYKYDEYNYKMKDLIKGEFKTKRKSSEGQESGKYPFFTNSTDKYSKYLDEFDFSGEYIIANTGGQAYFDYYKGKFSTMSDNYVIKIKEEFNAKYIYYGLKRNQSYINYQGFTGSGLKHLDRNWFRKFKFFLPNNKEQNKVVNLLDSLNEKKNLLEKEIEQLKLQKKGLMQQLLTGKIRVNLN